MTIHGGVQGTAAATVAAVLLLVLMKREWLFSVAAGPWGWLAVVGLLLLSCTTNLPPASLVVAAAGATYGTLVGTVACTLGLWLGALLPFCLARTLLRNVAARWLARSERMQRLDTALRTGGWRAVALLRLSPVMPFGTLSYGLGVSGVRWRDYCAGNLAVVPSLLFYVAAGAAAGDAARDGWRLGHLVLSLVGVALLGVTLLYLRRLARGAALEDR